MNFRVVTTLFVLCIVAEPTLGGIFGRLFHSDPEWNTLRVTWGVNLASENVFTKIPLKVKKATNDKGYIKDSTRSSCSGKFLGDRYVQPKKPGIALLYDHSGYFVGLQTYFPKSALQKSSLYIEDNVSGNNSNVLTAYFVDPDIICTTGRTKSQYEAQKIGNALYIQNGSNPLRDYIKVPLYENETVSNHWYKGSCFTSMGVHYWYNISKDMNCDNLLPLFLVFNHGKLTGFGWAIQDKIPNNVHFEYPDKDNLKRFFDSTPRCLKDIYTRGSGLSMMHVYMNSKPWNLLC
uniref:Uncharacterized protein n=1 Tax=Strigamia maritima TaxID=126957 RepID=T1J4X8_STRMM